MSMRLTVRALGLGCLLLSACADQQESLILTHAPSWPDEGCEIDAGNDDSLLFGILDVEQGTPYLMPAVLLNNLSDQTADSNNAGIVTNEVQVTGADVELASEQAPDLISYLEAKQDGLVDFAVPVASVSIAPGELEGFAIEVISQAASGAMRDYFRNNLPEEAAVVITAEVVFHGLRAGTSVGKIGVIDARSFSFPIRLCRNCLMSCGSCPDAVVCPPAEPGPFVGGVCGNAQDFLIAPEGCELPD